MREWKELWLSGKPLYESSPEEDVEMEKLHILNELDYTDYTEALEAHCSGEPESEVDTGSSDDPQQKAETNEGAEPMSAPQTGVSPASLR
ncbi:sperm flagellar protein 2 [Clarias magur]|uniref:Sperm flagellar protein 2 n=1 Tax=Clarias magur TaxID=1594786 RepID=A0A8J4WRC3_CLAMG|nr:sperm flagellar protein 2 [Clarias magur]